MYPLDTSLIDMPHVVFCGKEPTQVRHREGTGESLAVGAMSKEAPPGLKVGPGALGA